MTREWERLARSTEWGREFKGQQLEPGERTGLL